MASCNDCRFVRGRQIVAHEIPGGDVQMIKQGWCHRRSPRAFDMASGGWPPVRLIAWCGEHRYSILGIWRAIKALFGGF